MNVREPASKRGAARGARKDAEELSGRLDHGIEASADSIYVYNFDGTVLTWNRAAEALYGWTAEKIVGCNIDVIFPAGPVSEARERIISAIQSGESLHDFETVQQRRDGSTFPALLTALPILDVAGRPRAVSITVHDLAQRWDVQERLRLRNKQLALLARVSQLLILSEGTEDEILTAVFGEVAAAIGAEMYFNYQPHDGVSMRLCNWGGLTDDEHTLFETMRYGEFLCGRVAARRRPIVVEDIAHTDMEGSEAVRAAGYGAYIGLPLLAGGRLLGTIAFITRTKAHFAEGEVQMIQAVCDQTAAMLERIRLAKELQKSEERFRLLFEQSVDGIFVATPDARYVILMDIGMPKLNGYDACRRIREQPWGKNSLMVAQTGWSQEEDKRKATKGGFDFHLTKPIDLAQLENILAELRATTGQRSASPPPSGLTHRQLG